MRRTAQLEHGNVEMLRDGGSLAATFRDSLGHEYTLLITIQTQVLPTGGVELLRYAAPIFDSPRVTRPTPVTWEQAGVLFEQVRGVLGENQRREWVDLMSEVISTKGVLPARLGRVQRGSKSRA
jgi:hypothetical protein